MHGSRLESTYISDDAPFIEAWMNYNNFGKFVLSFTILAFHIDKSHIRKNIIKKWYGI